LWRKPRAKLGCRAKGGEREKCIEESLNFVPVTGFTSITMLQLIRLIVCGPNIDY
jgi:hypothetical protein